MLLSQVVSKDREMQGHLIPLPMRAFGRNLARCFQSPHAMEMVAGVYDAENKLAFCNCLLLYAQSTNEKQIYCGDEGTSFSLAGVMQTGGEQSSGVAMQPCTSLVGTAATVSLRASHLLMPLVGIKSTVSLGKLPQTLKMPRLRGR